MRCLALSVAHLGSQERPILLLLPGHSQMSAFVIGKHHNVCGWELYPQMTDCVLEQPKHFVSTRKKENSTEQRTMHLIKVWKVHPPKKTFSQKALS